MKNRRKMTSEKDSKQEEMAEKMAKVRVFFERDEWEELGGYQQEMLNIPL